MDKEELLNKLNSIMFETNITIKKLRELFKAVLLGKDAV